MQTVPRLMELVKFRHPLARQDFQTTQTLEFPFIELFLIKVRQTTRLASKLRLSCQKKNTNGLYNFQINLTLSRLFFAALQFALKTKNQGFAKVVLPSKHDLRKCVFILQDIFNYNRLMVKCPP